MSLSLPKFLRKNGKIIERNLALEQLTLEELMTQLREQGLEDVGKVKAAYMESDGHVSVIEQKEKRHGKGKTGAHDK